MKISDLREFVRLAHTLNYTETAKEFYITQPVLSKHIAGLERKLGGELFARTASGIELTRVGKAFLVDAIRIVECYDRAIENVARAKIGVGRSLSVGYLYGASRKILLPAVEAYSRIRPDVELSLKSCEMDQAFALLSSKEVDLIITTLFNSKSLLASGSYNHESLYQDALAIVMPADHRLASLPEVSVYDIVGETVLMSAAPFMSEYSASLMEVLAPIAGQIDVRREVHDLASMRFLVGRKGFITLTFKHVENAFEEFKAVPIKEAAHVAFDVAAVWRKTDDSQAIRDFVGMLKQCIDE